MKKNWNFPKAFLFDLDGVLIDSEPLHGQAWKETAALFDLNLTDDQLKLLRGKRRIDCANELVKLIPKTATIEVHYSSRLALAVAFGGDTAPGLTTVMDFIEIMTQADALDFGDLVGSAQFQNIEGASNCHGGL